MLLCEESGIPFITIARETGSVAPFIERQHVDARRQLTRENPTRDEIATARTEAGNPAIEALRAYLEGLRARGEQIPLGGGGQTKSRSHALVASLETFSTTMRAQSSCSMLTSAAQKIARLNRCLSSRTQHKLACHALKILSDYNPKDYRLLLAQVIYSH